MSEYIDKEEVIKEVKAWSMYGNDDVVSRIENLPSADVIPVEYIKEFCRDCSDEGIDSEQLFMEAVGKTIILSWRVWKEQWGKSNE